MEISDKIPNDRYVNVMLEETPPLERSPLFLSTFGSLTVSGNDKVLLRLNNGKIAALFAYLATEPGAHSREHLSMLFWPDMPSSSARLNLRQLLFQLRNNLQSVTGQSLIHVSRDHAEVEKNAALTVSSIAFMAPLPQCDGRSSMACQPCLAALTAQAELYQELFLAEISLPDCPDFEEWLQIKRELLHQQALTLFSRLADCHELNGNFTMASHFARRYVELEPWSEGGHLRLMRLYLQDGKHETALTHYETSSSMMSRELGVTPGSELKTLAETLRAQVPKLLPTNTSQERRQATVLYCSIQGSEIHDDPEEALDALQVPQAQCAQIISDCGGHAVRAYDGGLLAYFGYPKAMEHSVKQALRAARAATALNSERVAIRAGLHTGLILSSPQTPDAVGTTSRIAIQLRELASAGETLVSSEVQRRGAGFFQFKPLGKKRLSKEQRPLPVYRLIGETGAWDRLSATDRLTPFVGRESELAQLREMWFASKQGKFNALLVSGDAGIGKSRLLKTFTEGDKLKQQSNVVSMHCYQEAQHSPMQAVIGLLVELSKIQPTDSDEMRLVKLERLLNAHAPKFAESTLPIFTEIMGIKAKPNTVPPNQIPAMVQQLFVQLLHSIAEQQPTLLVVEDMHWADEITASLLQSLAATQRAVPLFLAMTARPQWQPGWTGLNVTRLMPLPDGDIVFMVKSVLTDIDSGQLSNIVTHSDGIPLFAEELATVPSFNAAVQQRGDLPPTLHDLLMSRIDALGDARTVMQYASTFGREIDISLLAELVSMELGELAEIMDRLLQSGLMQKTEGDQIRFKHALVQDAAYLSQTRQSRKTAHQQVAKTIERHAEHLWRDTPERLARHWQAAENSSRAAELWLMAGKRAALQYAHRDAVKHYESGLEQLHRINRSAKEDRHRLGLLLGLAQSDQVVSGYGNPRAVEILVEAEKLLAHGGIGDTHDLFYVLWGLWEGASSGQSVEVAIKYAERLIVLAHNERDDKLLAQAHYALGNSLFWHGQFMKSREHLETALHMLHSSDATIQDSYGIMVIVGVHAYLSWTLWMLGDASQAFLHSEEAVEIARQADATFSQAFALTLAATVQRWSGDVEKTAVLAEEGRAVAKSCGSALYELAMEMTCAWVSARSGIHDAFDFMEKGIDAMKSTMSAAVVEISGIYASALLHCGQEERALPVLRNALAMADEIDNRHCLSEMHRMKGVCLLTQNRRDEARDCFQKALLIAREQGAVYFEQRAINSLSALI